MKERNELNEVTVLISAASGAVGYGIFRVLKGSGCHLAGTAGYDDPWANCFADCGVGKG